MLKPLPLIGTLGMMALIINPANAQQTTDCDNNSTSLCSTLGLPDKGWNPPARLPVNRDGIWYKNYWPQAWHGNPGGEFIGNSPTVYQPSDTTQLGYSYAKVPTWRAKCMIPSTPCPSHFHARVCVPRAQQKQPINVCPDGKPSTGTKCQSCQQAFIIHAAPGIDLQKTTIVLAPLTVRAPVNAAPVSESQPSTATLSTIRSPDTADGVKNAVVRSTRPASKNRKKGLFRLTRFKYLFD